jgi:hypothetical protein
MRNLSMKHLPVVLLGVLVTLAALWIGHVYMGNHKPEVPKAKTGEVASSVNPSLSPDNSYSQLVLGGTETAKSASNSSKCPFMQFINGSTIWLKSSGALSIVQVAVYMAFAWYAVWLFVYKPKAKKETSIGLIG